jgi:hypothetical protein
VRRAVCLGGQAGLDGPCQDPAGWVRHRGAVQRAAAAQQATTMGSRVRAAGTMQKVVPGQDRGAMEDAWVALLGAVDVAFMVRLCEDRAGAQ